MRTRVSESYESIAADDWNALLTDSNPFLRHEFLAGLETSGCAVAETGWAPCPLLCESDDGTLLGAMPLYLKNHSQGEFVFDFAWASAYHQAGLQYYPKLVAAVPFTPATGPRILISPAAPDENAVRQQLVASARGLARANQASSLHILFTDKEETESLEQEQLMSRRDCQFHWQNNDYENFDEFLATFTSSKRKKTRRERRRIVESNIRFAILSGAEMTAELWDQVMPLYRTTFIRRGREPYINREFFAHICTVMPASIVVFIAYQDDQPVACSICFRSDDTLYGRYWGANRFIDSLHFETCYYQGIDYCIERGPAKIYEPGTQGEHKIARGFVPTLKPGRLHWLSHPQFSAAAVDDYLQREAVHIDELHGRGE